MPLLRSLRALVSLAGNISSSQRRRDCAQTLLNCLFLTAALSLTQAGVLAAGSDSPSPCAIHWLPDPGATKKVVVEVSGLSAPALKELRQADWNLAQWQRLLCVFTQQGEITTNVGFPTMLGSYRINGDMLRFEPQFPLAPGLSYRAVFDPNQSPAASGVDAKLISAVYKVPPASPTSMTVLSQVYPTATVLPENLLKFYLHFSAPMSRGHIYDYIHLRDQLGKDVELPFLEIDEELWNPDLTRLTLFIDPGRIKRGVRPLEEIGPALQEGKRYTLVIDRAWQDGLGSPLQATFQKSFKVTSPARKPLNPAHWKIRAPKSGTRQPLTVGFPEPMDHALALRVIHVINQSGSLVQGETALQDEERHWTFVPAAPWLRGTHRLLVETTIEDLAGNNIGKAFEVDLFDDTPGRLMSTTVKLPFEIP